MKRYQAASLASFAGAFCTGLAIVRLMKHDLAWQAVALFAVAAVLMTPMALMIVPAMRRNRKGARDDD